MSARLHDLIEQEASRVGLVPQEWIRAVVADRLSAAALPKAPRRRRPRGAGGAE